MPTLTVLGIRSLDVPPDEATPCDLPVEPVTAAVVACVTVTVTYDLESA